MPIYEYTCKDCNKEFDMLVNLSQRDEAIECLHCDSKNTSKKMTAPQGLKFKGGGCYDSGKGIIGSKQQ